MLRRVGLLAIVAACGGARGRGGVGQPEDPRHLYVEVAADRSPLVRGAELGLRGVGFAVPVGTRGDLALQLEASHVGRAGNRTTCGVKILVLRLPQRDLLGIADGNAYAGGTDAAVAAECLESLAASLVGGRVRPLLQRQLDAKR